MRYVLLLLVITWSNLSQASNVAQIPIHKFYPQCDYQIIDEIILKQKLIYPQGQRTKDVFAEAFIFVVKDASLKAQKSRADGIILLDRKVNLIEKRVGPQTREPYEVVEFRAQLIKDCELDPLIPKKLTPIGPNGRLQKTLSAGNEDKRSVINIEIALPTNQKRHTPELNSDLISFSQGVYGVTLGSDIESVELAFGTPTFVMQIDPQHQLVAYGRRHWFIFYDGLLEFASTNSPWFSNEFINLLAFDGRFDDMRWTIQDRITQSDKLTSAIEFPNYFSQNNNEIILRSDKQEILIHTEKYKNEGKESRVVGFTLRRQDFVLPTLKSIDSSSIVLKKIKAYFTDKDRNELNFQELEIKPLAAAWLDSTSQLLVLGRHLIAEQRGSQISKLHFIEDVFDVTDIGIPEKWSFNGLQQGQSLQQVLELIGDDAFHMEDMVEITRDKYSQNLYFYMKQDTLRLLTSEISIY